MHNIWKLVLVRLRSFFSASHRKPHKLAAQNSKRNQRTQIKGFFQSCWRNDATSEKIKHTGRVELIGIGNVSSVLKIEKRSLLLPLISTLLISNSNGDFVDHQHQERGLDTIKLRHRAKSSSWTPSNPPCRTPGRRQHNSIPRTQSLGHGDIKHPEGCWTVASATHRVFFLPQ